MWSQSLQQANSSWQQHEGSYHRPSLTPRTACPTTSPLPRWGERKNATCTPEYTALLSMCGAGPVVAVAIATLAGDAVFLEDILRALGAEASAVLWKVTVILAGPAHCAGSLHLCRKKAVRSHTGTTSHCPDPGQSLSAPKSAKHLFAPPERGIQTRWLVPQTDLCQRWYKGV